MADRSAAGLAVLAAALALWPSATGAVSRRARQFAVAPAGRRRGRPTLCLRQLAPSTRRWLFAGTGGAAVAVLVGGTWGPFVGAAAAVLVERVMRRADVTPTAEEIARALPLVCELLAVCLEAGVPPGAALAAVAEGAPAALADPLGRVAGLYRLGADPSAAWAGAPPGTDRLARAFVRAGASGSAVVPALHAIATDVRASSRARTEAAVRRAGVWVLAPLGACFLPAFLCLGVVPLVLGIARDVFG